MSKGLLETQFGRRLVFDATRVYDQLGRYINHSSIGANCNYWCPLFVRGVGCVALQDIPEGEQLTYDYGIRNQSWMIAVSPKKADNCPQKCSSEAKRRFSFCPVPGCTSRKPLKKLSNHLTALHPGITKLEREKYLREAKKAEPRTHAATQVPLKVQRTLSGFLGSYLLSDDEKAPDSHRECSTEEVTRRSKGKVPVGGRVKGKFSRTETARGSTKCYQMTESRFLTALYRHAIAKFGLSMAPGPATEMVVDVSKFLYFAAATRDPDHITECPQYLVNSHLVQKYLEKLEADGIESSGRLAKLSHIEQASLFASAHFKWDKLDRSSRCEQEAMKTFSNWKKRLLKERTKRKQPLLSEELPAPNYMHILTMEEPRAFVESSKTLENLFDKYLIVSRGRGSSKFFFVNHAGVQPSKLPKSVQLLAKEYGIVLPELTMHRKVMGTKASILKLDEQEKVAAFMKHSLATQQRYDRHLQAKKDSVEAFLRVAAGIYARTYT